ncbi:MAG: Gfo/Idh/MocA family protein [Gemmatimonadaceae bacterium]
MSPTRRDFLKTTAATSLGAAMTNGFPALLSNRSPNETLVVAVCGLNGRGGVHLQNFGKSIKNAEVAYLCDVDSNVLARAQKAAASDARAPKAIGDFRRALDDKDVDVVSIATPDHWHTPMAILAMKAGKHVYCEKPSSQNAREAELFDQAQKKYKRVVQIGTQQRSSPRTIEALAAIKDGVIGAPYLTRAWYANNRVGIGKGRQVPVPPNLDYDLWQGPAPRTPYHDNYIHYNWHWFRRWGTGEIHNNGTHEIDIARLTLGVGLPTAVMSTGSRTHYADDWEFPDSQEATYEFEGGKRIIWMSESCNATPTFDRGRGTATYGTKGTLVLDRDGYAIYDLKGKVVKQNIEPKRGNGTDIIGDDAATLMHMENFAAAIRAGDALRAPVSDAIKTNITCHLGNIAQFTGRRLAIDPATGHVKGDADAMKFWGRDYEPGWAPTLSS